MQRPPLAVPRSASIVTALVAALVLVGWIFHLPVATSFIPGLPTMQVDSAICFLLSALAMWLWNSEPTRVRQTIGYASSRSPGFRFF